MNAELVGMQNHPCIGLGSLSMSTLFAASLASLSTWVSSKHQTSNTTGRSTKPLYHGLWCRRFMTKLRFKQISKLCNPNIQVAPENKLHKVELLYKFVKARCKALYQPGQNIVVDERMVQNKDRYNFRQFMKDKPVRWGMKFWVLACAVTGYTYDFDLYLRKTNLAISPNSLGFDVVVKLVAIDLPTRDIDFLLTIFILVLLSSKLLFLWHQGMWHCPFKQIRISQRVKKC